jgi:hypothetical protein
LKSAEVLFTPDFANYFLWIREPGYPLFIRVLEDLGGLLLVFIVQSFFISFGIISTIIAFYRAFGIDKTTWKTYVSASIAIVLLAGYASTLLQQAFFVAIFGFLLIIIQRIVERKVVDLLTSLMVFSLLFFSTITAVFIGLAFGLALFGTLIAVGFFRLRSIVTYASLGAIAFMLVMLPWSQIKSISAPPTAGDSLEIGSSSAASLLQNFNPEKELHELVLTQAALLNLGGELPHLQEGIGIANENRIFGAPVYTIDHKCGRFLTHLEPDNLWGKIETSYNNRCVLGIPLQLISFVNKASHLLYPLVGISIVFALLLSFRFAENLRPLLIPSFLVLTPYLLLDASISRYGALIIPLGCVLLIELFSSTQKLVAHPTSPTLHKKIV